MRIVHSYQLHNYLFYSEIENRSFKLGYRYFIYIFFMMTTLAPYERFFINVIIYISFVLIGVLLLAGLLFFFKIDSNNENLTILVNNKTIKRQKKKKASYSESLGKKVVDWMVEISKSDNKNLVEDRIAKIIVECEKLNRLNLPDDKKKVISTVLLWAKNFNTNRHIQEIKNYKESTQIIYDKKKNDFKLLITKE